MTLKYSDTIQVNKLLLIFLILLIMFRAFFMKCTTLNVENAGIFTSRIQKLDNWTFKQLQNNPGKSEFNQRVIFEDESFTKYITH